MLSLELCFRDAQLRTDLYALENPETWSMGTTLVVGWVCQDQLLVAWLGDSRCYVYIPENGLRQVTSDHSLVQEMVDAGEITVQQASLHPMKNIITRALYAGSDKEPKPDYATIDLQPGMRILLCSDGLSNMVSDHDMGDMLRDLPNVQACATRLVEAANHEGGIDNITVVVAEVSA